MPKTKSFSNELQFLFIVNLTILILILSIFNLQYIKRSEIKVLGATDDSVYWEEMVKKHPTYRDGWLELDRMDKVYEIDPNYIELTE